MNTIILSAAKSGSSNSFSASVGMQPVRGKPSISYCIDSLDVKDLVVVVRNDNADLVNYLNGDNFLGKNIKVVVFDPAEHSVDHILQSLFISLEHLDEKVPTQLILGDTAIEDLPDDQDVFLVSNEVKTSNRWCLVTTNEKSEVVEFFDKKLKTSLADKQALVGYYSFSNTALLKESVLSALSKGGKELSDAFERYIQTNPVTSRTVSNWLDFGHITGVVNARISLFNARDFNNMSVNSELGTITKKSKKSQKLIDELEWYKNLPAELSVLAPRVLKAEDQGEEFLIEMELFGYPNLSEVFVYGDQKTEDWIHIIEKLFKLHKQLEKFSIEGSTDEREGIYLHKTTERLDALKSDRNFTELLKSDYLYVNGEKLKNLKLMEGALFTRCKEIASDDGAFGVTHGDFCFSNILFDSMHYIFRLIDPRGRFKEQTIYGDPRYDIAKLRHSAVGLYDYITLGFYRFSESDSNVFDFEILAKDRDLAVHFDELTKANGFDVEDIKFIEALLFLTMIPYHSDDVNRQKAFYLTAMKKLNNLL